MLAISVVLLIVFVVNKNTNSQLYCSASDIEICKGETIYDFYEVTNENAEISFTVDCENIIEINDLYIRGLKAGEVNVTIKAQYKGEISIDEFCVKVYDESYRVEFVSILDCVIGGNTITALSNSFQFKVEIFDALNRKIENVEFEILPNEDITIIKNFYSILIVADRDCKVDFSFKDIDIEVEMNIVSFKG